MVDAAFIYQKMGKEKYDSRCNKRDNFVYNRLSMPFSFVFGIPEICMKT